MVCNVCFRHCKIEDGQKGFCGARICRNGKITADNYGKITSIALDPIEKKPLRMFYPGMKILSVGSYGCNLRCPFCQNSEISWSNKALECKNNYKYYSPEALVKIALQLKKQNNIGIAFTYNEPLIGYEFVKDVAELSHKSGMKNILVSNGTATFDVLKYIAPYIDAMNIDLKAFSDSFYKNMIDGDLQMTKDFIKTAVKFCHVELTTLVITCENDGDDEMNRLSHWVAELEKQSGRKIPLHITRFFPSFKLKDREPTPVDTILGLVGIARKNLEYVFPGNI